MNSQEAALLLDSIYPGFFERDIVRGLPEGLVFEEMILPLSEFDMNIYRKNLDSSITFGFYEGDLGVLREKVERVVGYWGQSYNGKHRIYCGYIGGEAVSFCLAEDKGTYDINGRRLKIGGPGCMGTLPEYRNMGIGLTMVKNVTEILKEEGFDIGYIHFTGVADWYRRLGYRSILKWDKHGVV